MAVAHSLPQRQVSLIRLGIARSAPSIIVGFAPAARMGWSRALKALYVCHSAFMRLVTPIRQVRN